MANIYRIEVHARDLAAVPARLQNSTLTPSIFKHWAVLLLQDGYLIAFSELDADADQDGVKLNRNNSNPQFLIDNLDNWSLLGGWDVTWPAHNPFDIVSVFNREADNSLSELTTYDGVNNNCQQWANGILKAIVPTANIPTVQDYRAIRYTVGSLRFVLGRLNSSSRR